uniref:Uncharacterized protein n=1 Tax=Anguilla anguilla TaxID=7936 RepID=A0A0E9SDR0_ANGAN
MKSASNLLKKNSGLRIGVCFGYNYLASATNNGPKLPASRVKAQNTL